MSEPILPWPDPVLSRFRERLPQLALLLALLIHLGGLWTQEWTQVKRSKDARDFASYYYAVQVAAQGGDPYDTPALSARARMDRTRNAVHPFFYPPPFLLVSAWVLPLSLAQAYRAWFWLDTLALGLIWFGVRRLVKGDAALWVGAVGLLAFTPLPNNHLMGQANLPVLAAAVWGLWLAERDEREQLLGGALMGLACMMKMSPGLWVAWWLLRGRWRPAFASVATALLLSALSLPLLDAAGQLRFYTEVLPGFGSGDYNGLTVPILLFGNHSVPNLWAQLYPGSGALSDMARLGSGVSNLALMLGALWALRTPSDSLSLANAAGALAVVMVVVPVYAYEHHLTFLILTLLAVGAACAQGRLGRVWWIPLLLAGGVLCWPLTDLKDRAQGLPWPWKLGVQELKFVALVVLGLGAAVAARASPEKFLKE